MPSEPKGQLVPLTASVLLDSQKDCLESNFDEKKLINPVTSSDEEGLSQQESNSL